MADRRPTLADFLRGRIIPPAGPRAPYSYAPSEFTTADEMRQERVSQALGWDTSRPWRKLGMDAATYLPLALRSPAGARMPLTSPRPSPTPPPGPWQPGYLDTWLQGRYQPAARPQARQPSGSVGNEAPSFTWGDVVAGRLRMPQNRAEMMEAAKGVGAAGAAGGVGGAGGMYLTDRLYHGRSPEESSWRALVGPSAGEPPSWWPQPQPEQKPLPPSGPQPPSQLRSGW
jgi:hypothetical protein